VQFPYRPGVVRDTRLYRNGKEVGRITSVAKLPTTTIRTALAYVRREAWEPDTPLAIGSPEAPADARVGHLPLIDPDAPGQEQER
jgi:glycine cleavage system aminomethyltransferase T